MKTFASPMGGRIVVIRMTRGELLRECILQGIEDSRIQNGVILSGLGTLDRCTLHMVTNTAYPPQEHYPTWNEPLELVSLTGIIANGEAHIHAVVSNKEHAYAGHLENHCRVLFLAEVVIYEHENLLLERRPLDGIPALETAE